MSRSAATNTTSELESLIEDGLSSTLIEYVKEMSIVLLPSNNLEQHDIFFVQNRRGRAAEERGVLRRELFIFSNGRNKKQEKFTTSTAERTHSAGGGAAGSVGSFCVASGGWWPHPFFVFCTYENLFVGGLLDFSFDDLKHADYTTY
jgi:hypothetical protein